MLEDGTQEVLPFRESANGFSITSLNNFTGERHKLFPQQNMTDNGTLVVEAGDELRVTINRLTASQAEV